MIRLGLEYDDFHDVCRMLSLGSWGLPSVGRPGRHRHARCFRTLATTEYGSEMALRLEASRTVCAFSRAHNRQIRLGSVHSAIPYQTPEVTGGDASVR